MHLVSVLLPIEAVVTLYSCSMWFFFPMATISPDAAEVGYGLDGERPANTAYSYVEFNSTTHYALHLVPLVGLALNYAAYRAHYRHRSGGCGRRLLIPP